MRAIHIKMLPGSDLKKVRIHWMILDEQGPIETPRGEVLCTRGSIVMGGVKGRIACQPGRQSVLPEVRSDGIHLLLRSENINAVNCPECLASAEAKAHFQRQKEQGAQATKREASEAT